MQTINCSIIDRFIHLLTYSHRFRSSSWGVQSNRESRISIFSIEKATFVPSVTHPMRNGIMLRSKRILLSKRYHRNDVLVRLRSAFYSTILSISEMSSGVNSRLSAWAFCSTWSARLAPAMTDPTAGLDSSH